VSHKLFAVLNSDFKAFKSTKSSFKEQYQDLEVTFFLINKITDPERPNKQLYKGGGGVRKVPKIVTYYNYQGIKSKCSPIKVKISFINSVSRIVALISTQALALACTFPYSCLPCAPAQA
jgi:hypothetical protein